MTLATAARSKRPPEERIRARNVARILKAAIEVFARKGYDGARIAEIADACGLPKANVYYYFSTKEEIYTSLFESVMAGWDRALEEIDAAREPAVAIRAYVGAKLEYSRRHSAESRFFAGEMMRGGEFLTRRQRHHIQRVTRERRAVVEAWIQQGKLTPVDPGHFFIMLWSATQFYADFQALATTTLERPRLTKADFEAAAETISGIILSGCLPAPAPA